MDLDLERTYKRWWIQLLTGLALIALGIILMVWPGITTLVVLIFVAVFILVDGLFAIGNAIGAMSRKEPSGLMWARGIIEIIIGAIALLRPGATLLAATIIIGIWLVIDGILEIYSAFKIEEATTGFKVLLGLGGLLSIVIGVLFWFLPVHVTLAFVIVIGIFAILVGLARIVIGLMLRAWISKARKAAAA
jgi:uncharacterized membrane protein HdeD (DUF308 family)